MCSLERGKDYDKELYEWYKAHHICPSCGRRSAAPGRVRCEICLAVGANRGPHPRDPGKYKELRERRKAEGKCIWCGKPLAADSKCFCKECQIKNRRRQIAKRDSIARSERPAFNLCYVCGAPIADGTLCGECRERCISHLPAPSKDSAWYQYHKRRNNVLFGGPQKEEQLEVRK